MNIRINGINISCSSGNISITNDKVMVDGKVVEVGEQRDVYIEGDVNNITCNGNVTVTGNVKGNIDCGGNIKCNNIDGDIDAGGSVQSGAVGGSIDAGNLVRFTALCAHGYTALSTGKSQDVPSFAGGTNTSRSVRELERLYCRQ